MGKGRKAQDPSRFGSTQGPDRHALYQQAVQYSPGDIYWMTKFYRKYIGTKAPCHLREDFCGTALISSTWCRQDVCRTATGIDLDADVLKWGLQHNMDGCCGRLCLIQANVLQPPSSGHILTQQQQQQQQQQQPAAALGVGAMPAPAQELTSLYVSQTAAAPAAGEGSRQEHAGGDGQYVAEDDAEGTQDLVSKPADIICAFNFSVCLLHKRSEVLTYFRHVREALCTDPGGVFVLDLMGGHSVEMIGQLKRTNFKSGIRYTFEQERFNPFTRNIRCHITLQDPVSKRVLRRAFTYNWRLWGVADVVELLKEAGFGKVAVWVRRLQGTGSTMESDEGDDSDGDDDGSSACSSSSGRRRTADSDSDCEESGGDNEGPDEAAFVEYNPTTATTAYLNQLAKGWTAYVVAVTECS